MSRRPPDPGFRSNRMGCLRVQLWTIFGTVTILVLVGMIFLGLKLSNASGVGIISTPTATLAITLTPSPAPISMPPTQPTATPMPTQPTATPTPTQPTATPMPTQPTATPTPTPIPPPPVDPTSFTVTENGLEYVFDGTVNSSQATFSPDATGKDVPTIGLRYGDSSGSSTPTRGPLTWSVEIKGDGGNWLSLSSSKGTLTYNGNEDPINPDVTSTVSATVLPAMAAGTYHKTIQFYPINGTSDNNQNNASATLNVSAPTSTPGASVHEQNTVTTELAGIWKSVRRRTGHDKWAIFA